MKNNQTIEKKELSSCCGAEPYKDPNHYSTYCSKCSKLFTPIQEVSVEEEECEHNSFWEQVWRCRYCKKEPPSQVKPESENPYKEYIEFLEKVISSTATYLHFHGQPASEEDIAKGRELREKIKKYEMR